MKDLNKELLNEKMKLMPNKSAVLFLQRVLDGHSVTKTEFVSTMNITSAEHATNVRPNCANIIDYAGGFRVQVLTDGTYLYEVFDNQESDEMHTRVKSKELKDIVSFIWRYEADKLFNKQK